MYKKNQGVSENEKGLRGGGGWRGARERGGAGLGGRKDLTFPKTTWMLAYGGQKATGGSEW